MGRLVIRVLGASLCLGVIAAGSLMVLGGSPATGLGLVIPAAIVLGIAAAAEAVGSGTAHLARRFTVWCDGDRVALCCRTCQETGKGSRIFTGRDPLLALVLGTAVRHHGEVHHR